MRRLVVVLAALTVAAVAAAPTTQAAHTVSRPRSDAWPLHPGSRGPRVAALQWMLAGHCPNRTSTRCTVGGVHGQIKPTLHRYTVGVDGSRTTAALLAYRWRLGFPKAGQCGAKTSLLVRTVKPWFFALLEGKAKRPACWVALAAARVKAVNVGPTAAALRIRAYELHLLDLNIHEIPDGSNRGPAISYPALGAPALQSGTGAYGLAWCVSTQQTVFKLLGYGTFADDTAGVYAAVDYYAARNDLSAKPKVGALVAFIEYDSHGARIPGTGHMGFVVKVEASSFTYTAGNDGNAFREHTIPDSSRSHVFIYLPGIAG